MDHDLSGTPLPARPTRIAWIDLCKGVLMILVVILHCTSYFKFTGGVVPAPVLAMTSFVSPVRMPTLIFLSGMMVDMSLRKGTRAFVASRARTLAWPYVVWCVLWALASGQAGRLGEPAFWTGDWYLWFLLFIVLYSLIAVLVPVRYHLVGAAWAYLAALYVEDGTKYPERLLFFLSLFLAGSWAGSWMGRDRESFERLLPRGKVLLALLPAVLAILIASALTGPIRYSPHDYGMIAVVVVAALALCKLAAERARFPAIEFIGRNSLVIYLTHMPVIALVLAGLRAVGMGGFVPAFVLSFGISGAVSLAMVRLAAYSPAVNLLFAWPRRAGVAAGGTDAPPRAA